MGRGNKYFKVGGLRFLQALTPRERCCRFVIASPSEPLSRHRERGWGERADALRLPWERFCAQYGFRFFVGEKSKSVSSTASDRGLGAAPQACFGSFYTSKRNAPAASRTGCHLSVTSPRRRRLQARPRRAGVQIKTFCKALPAVRRQQTISRPGGEPY